MDKIRKRHDSFMVMLKILLVVGLVVSLVGGAFVVAFTLTEMSTNECEQKLLKNGECSYEDSSCSVRCFNLLGFILILILGVILLPTITFIGPIWFIGLIVCDVFIIIYRIQMKKYEV